MILPFSALRFRALAFLFLAAVLANCGQTAYFGDASRMQTNNRMAIYLDRDGSLYPPEGPVVNKKELENNTGYLLAYYMQHPADQDSMLAAEGIAPRTDIEQAWPLLQHKLRMAASHSITQRLESLGPTATLVMLVHGFNNTADESIASFQAAERKMKQMGLPHSPHLFLEVYWDGRFGTSLPAFFTYSQANAKFVGLSLREVLSNIPDAHPIRILTHSLGAVVVANALWNVTAAMGVPKIGKPLPDIFFWQQLNGGQGYSFRNKYKDATYYKTPTHPNIRWAMVAPATPGETFTDYLDRTPTLGGRKSTYQRIIVGANQYDEVLTRKHTNLPLLGHTSLGFNPADYTDYVDKIVNGDASGTAQRFQLYAATNPYRNKHSWQLYTQQSEMMPQLLQALLQE